jgi:hypothetical protein
MNTATETAEIVKSIADIAIKHTAIAMQSALANDSNGDVFTWLGVCHHLFTEYVNAGFAIDRIAFYEACGFDMAVGHYDWRSDWR